MQRPVKKKQSSEESTTSSTATTSSSDSEEISRDSENDESDDDEFVDAPEASGTLISKFLNQTERLVTAVNSISTREDLTKMRNWGGSPAYDTPPAEPSAKASSAAETPDSLGVPVDRGDAGSSKSSTLRGATDRARQHKLNETRKRLIQGEEEDDDDDEIVLYDEDGGDAGKLGLVAAGPGSRSSHSSNSPSQTSSCDGASVGKQSTSASLSLHPFKVVEEQDNVSVSRYSHGPRGLTPAQSLEGSYVGRPPDIISSCNEAPTTDSAIASTSKSYANPLPEAVRTPDQVDSPTPSSSTPGIMTPPPIPPPRRKKRRNTQTPGPSEPRSGSPTVSIRSHVMTDARNSIYPLQASGMSATKVVVTAQDEEKTRSKSSGPRFLRRTESIGLVQSENQTSVREKQEEQQPEETEPNRTIPLPTNPNSGKSSSLRAQGNSRSHGRVTKNQSGPGSYSLPGPHLGKINSEIKKHSLPILRSKTDSGKQLSDLEILEQVTVLNLDTGERIPLSSAEDKIPKCVNPLTLHIMRLTSEYVSEEKQNLDSDDDDNSSSRVSTTTSEGFKRKRTQLKKFIGNVGRSALNKAKSVKAAAASRLGSKSVDEAESEPSSSLPLPQPPLFPMHESSAQPTPQQRQNVPPSSLKFGSSNYLAPPVPVDAASVMTSSSNTLEGPTILKMKASPKHKGPYDFENLELVQELTKAPPPVRPDPTVPSTPSASSNAPGPIWCMKFSNCGRLLAAAGQERVIKVFVLKSQLNYFVDLIKSSKVSPTPSVESVNPGEASFGPSGPDGDDGGSANRWPFVPLSSYAGHTADLLDIAWSKSFFLLSSSMDRTVRLWHISRKECLCTFQHVDFVTAIAFHPRDDRYFLSGSLDSKVRIWNIPDKKVALWNEVPGPNNLITTANFCQNGKFAVVGTYDGRVIFYHTEQLKYHTQIILNKKKCVKISGIESMPGEDKILVTSNDSRIRLFDLRDLSLNCKYTGSVTRSSQIKASFSHDGKFLISGSENNFIYLWRTAHEFVGFRGGARRDRNKYWEGVRVHNAVVTCAIFSPDPDLIIKEMAASDASGENTASTAAGSTGTGPRTGYPADSSNRNNSTQLGYVIASADFLGQIKICICRIKPKCSSLPVSAIA